MNLPDWLSLSATSGTGSGRITATVDKCTARAARRTTEFSVKTDSGSSRRVRVIQNGIAEFVNITNPTGDVAIPDTIPEGYAVVITGTSNSPILTFTVSGSLMLTNTQAVITDENSNSINFISGSPIDGDPGASAMYSYTLVFKPTSNTTANELKSTFTISSQSGASASVNFTQAAGSGIVASVPRFVNNQAKTVPAEGIAAIENVAVYNPDAIPWDILVVPTPPALVTDITIQEGVESEYITPLTVSVLGNENTESGRQYILYLVPEGATNTAVVYSSMVVNQLAAPVNPYIEGDYEMTSYAGGLVTLRVIDQKNVGWYPEAIFKDATQTEIPSNPCTVLITGTSDKGVSYTDADSGTVFSQEAGNVKIVGDGIVKIHINNSYEDGYSATMNLRVSIDDLVTEPYDYVVVGISNIPQFDFEEYEIVLGPSDASIVDNLLTIGNPNGVPFTITTSDNPSSRRKATIYAGSNMVYDDTDGMQPVVLTDDYLALSVTASERGQFNIALKSQDGTTVFDTITLKVYRQPAIKFAVESSQLNPTVLHVTEPLVNVATVYKNYANFSPSPSYSESDIMSNVAVTYSIESGEQSAILFEMDSATNAAKVTGFQVLNGEVSHLVVIRATYEGSETDFYKGAYAEYAVNVMRTQAYVRIDNFDAGQSYISLYKPATDDLPDTKQVLYTVLVDKYTGFQEKGEPVVYNTIFPEDIIDMTFTSTEFTPGGEPYLSINGDVITAAAVPTVEGPAVIPVNMSLGYTNHFAQFPTDEYPVSFNVRVLANTHYVLRVQPSTGTWAHTIDYTDGGVTRTEYYLYYEASVDGSGANPYSLTITLTNDITNGQNDVPMNHTIRFRDISGEYTTETGLENVILENDVISVKRTGSDAISTSAQSHQVTVVLKGNSGGSRGASFTIYADVEGVPLENNFTVYVNQRGEQSKSYSLEPDGQEVCSDGRQLNYWLEEIIANGVPCYEDSHDLPLVIKYNGQVNSGESLPYPLAGQLISAEYTYYVDYGDGQWVSPPDGSPESAQWLHLEAQDGTSNITTDANGKVNARIWWNANSSNEIKRKCEMILTCTLYNPSSNRYAPEPITANLVGTGNGVIQNEYTVTLSVKFFSNNVEVTTRTVAENYIESEPAYVARAYLNGVQVTDPERLTITYSASDGTKLSVDPTTGLISNLHAGTAAVEAHATWLYDSAQELYYEGDGSYSVLIERVKSTPTITYSIPQGLVYRNVNTHEITAWSDSGAEVFITPAANEGLMLLSRTVEEEDGKLITKQSFRLLTPAEAEASTPHKRVATDANGIEILFTCAAVGDYLAGTASGALVIGKYVDVVTSWDVTSVNANWVQLGGSPTSRIYKISTATGNTPKVIEAGQAYYNALNYDAVTLTWPYNNDKTMFRIVAKENRNNVGPATYRFWASLTYDDYNYESPAMTDLLKAGWYSDTQYVYTYPDSPDVITRSVSFAEELYSVAVGGTTPTGLVFNPSNSGGTKTYSVISGSNSVSIDSSGVLTGLATTQTPAVIRVDVGAANGYSGCTATTQVEVGKVKPTVTFAEPSLSLDAGEVKYVTATSTYGRTVYYSAYGYTDIISVSRQSDGRCKVTGLAAGSAQIRAYTKASDEYAVGEARLNVSVGSVVENCAIVFSETEFTLESGLSLNLADYVSTIFPPSGTTVSYAITSGDSSAASVSGSIVTANTVTISKTIQVTATASASGYNDGTATVRISVQPSELNSRTLTLSPTLSTLYEVNTDGYAYQTDLNPSPNPSLGSTGSIAYSCNNNYINISSAGRVTVQQGAASSSGTQVTITATCTETGYNPAVATARITVYQVPSSEPTPEEPETRQDYIIFNPVPSGTITLMMTDVYENLATSQSGQTVSFASSNGTIADVLAARVTIPSNASGTATLTLAMETSPEVTETCTINVTASALDSKNLRNVSWTSKGQTINVNAGDSFILTPKTDTSVTSSSRLAIPNSVHGNIERYVHWATSSSSVASVAGGVVTPVTASSDTITIKARVQNYTDTTNNIIWLGNNSYYSLVVSKVSRTITLKYPNSKYILPAGNGSTPVQQYEDFNIVQEIYPALGQGESVVFSSSSNLVAIVDSNGIVYPNTSIDTATITASIAENATYNAAKAQYQVQINGYEMEAYRNGTLVSNNDQITIPVSGQGGIITLVYKYLVTTPGVSSRVPYNDTFQQITAYECTCATQGTTAESHTASFYIPRNWSGSSISGSIQSISVFGQAISLVKFQQARGGSDDPNNQRYLYYDITRGNKDNIQENQYYDHSDPWNSTTGQVDTAGLMNSIGGYDCWTIGEDSLISNAAGNDEWFYAGSPDLRLTNASGPIPIWMEAYKYTGGASRVTTSTSGITTSITYIVQYWSETYGEWTTDTSRTGQGQWCGVYVGDGNGHSGQYSPSQSGYISVGSTGKIYPHIEWLANTSGTSRYARVIFMFDGSGSYDYMTAPMYIARVWQQG